MISKAIQKLDEIPEYVLLIVNLCLASFVGFAHGGALVITLTKDLENFDQIVEDFRWDEIG